MPHPKMFDDADPRLARVREIALGFPGAAEKVSHGHPAFFTTKVFAYYGGSQRIDGAWVRHEHTLLVLPDPAEREPLLADERCYQPAYLGAYGWVGIAVPAPRAARRAWAEIAELVDESYRNTAGKRLVAELDARG